MFWNALNHRVLTVILLAGLAVCGKVLFSPAVAFRLPGHNQGYSPRQPIAFSHKLHAGQLGINCQYCHFTAERSVHAGLPTVQTCLNCHRFVNPNKSPEIQKIYDAAGMGQDSGTAPKIPKPIEWVRIHELPAFVRFDHSRHVLAGVACQTCHGPIEQMDRVRQEKSLAMGMCVNCHRQVNKEGVLGQHVHASLDCAACHY